MDMKKLYYHQFTILKQPYLLAATSTGLAFVGSSDDLSELSKFYPDASLIDDESKLRTSRNELEDYLSGKIKTFDLELDISGRAFQKKVWQALRQIPYGQTKSYTQIAEEIHEPKAVRAVGSAIGKNPVLMVVPCHRVVTKAGKVGQYRGGVEMKRKLLKLEGHLK